MESERSVINAYRTQSSMKDYPGRMAGLFFTPGCNFRCGFCHNPDLFTAAKTYSWEELGEIAERFRRQWVSAVAITGGEPTIHPGLPDTIRFFKKRGFAVKLDTNGSNPQMLADIIGDVNYVAMDIKCALSGYKALTCYEDTAKIQESIRIVMERAKDYEFRTTLIEAVHNDDDLRSCGQLIEGAKLYILQPFVPHDNLPSVAMRDYPRTRSSFLEHAEEVVRPYVQKVIIRGAE